MIQIALITGAAGFIGRSVARYLAFQGFQVVGVDNAPEENSGMSGVGRYHQMTLPDAGLNSLLDECRPNLCIHCAGRASVALSVSEPASDYSAGPTLTFDLLNSIRLHAPECKVIFLSSAAVYGNPESLPITELHLARPVSPYGFHKFQSELICREFAEIYRMKTASLRIFSAYGAGLRRQVLWDICRKALSPGVVRLQGTGAESRDFIHVEDIAQAIHRVASNAGMRGEIYNVASGSETSIAELARLVLSSLKLDRACEFDGIIPPGTPLNWRADISQLESIGFKPAVSLRDGVAAFAAWCKAESGLLSITPSK